jgi:hypothetical protein
MSHDGPGQGAAAVKSGEALSRDGAADVNGDAETKVHRL